MFKVIRCYFLTSNLLAVSYRVSSLVVPMMCITFGPRGQVQGEFIYDTHSPIRNGMGEESVCVWTCFWNDFFFKNDF
ncbi:hypothetical protein FKM82_027494 [Ascaphus truei]